MGAPEGNTNARKENRIFGDELKKAMAQGGREQLRTGIEKLLKVAEGGDQPALTFFADRLDGKPAQGVTLGGDEDNPLRITGVTRKIVESGGT